MLMLVKICLATRHWFTDWLKGMNLHEAVARLMEDVASLRRELGELKAKMR